MFTGRRFDDETQLYYYRARMYHPELGRFIQPDPIGQTAGMNLYVYVGNNPLNWIDPLGLDKDGCDMSPQEELEYIKKQIEEWNWKQASNIRKLSFPVTNDCDDQACDAYEFLENFDMQYWIPGLIEGEWESGLWRHTANLVMPVRGNTKDTVVIDVFRPWWRLWIFDYGRVRYMTREDFRKAYPNPQGTAQQERCRIRRQEYLKKPYWYMQ